MTFSSSRFAQPEIVNRRVGRATIPRVSCDLQADNYDISITSNAIDGVESRAERRVDWRVATLITPCAPSRSDSWHPRTIASLGCNVGFPLCSMSLRVESGRGGRPLDPV